MREKKEKKGRKNPKNELIIAMGALQVWG